MPPQTQKLYEAAKKIQTWILTHPRKATIVRSVIDEFNNVLSAFEQSQQEENKTAEEILHYMKKNKDNCGAIYGTQTYVVYDDVIKAMQLFASQQTASKDKEIAELKVALSELIQVKDYKDKYGKDEHYLKACPIAWNNVRKLIEK